MKLKTITSKEGWGQASKQFQAAMHQTSLLIKKLDKLEADNFINYRSVSITDPETNQDYAFMWYNDEGMLECHEITFKYTLNMEKYHKYVKGIVKQLRYLYSVESQLRREMKLEK